MMMASYLFPRRISRSTNLTQSSTSHRTGAFSRPEERAFSFAHATMPLEASTWVTCAPAAAAASVAPPVYAKRFKTLTGRCEFFISPENQSQFAACSGNNPVCLKLKGFRLKVSVP